MFTIGQQVAVINTQRRGRTITTTRKSMEIASELITSGKGEHAYTGYRLRRIGSTSKGGQCVIDIADLEAI